MIKSMSFQTPHNICNYMVSLLPNEVKTVLEPTAGEGNLVKALEAYNVYAPKNFWIASGNWDAIVMNPPFSPMQVGYKILYRCMEMTNIIIALMPWLLLINSKKRTTKILDWGLKSITHLPRKTFKGTRVQTCIINMVRGYKKPIIWTAKD